MFTKIRNSVFEFLFRKLIPFKWIDGHKTQIARISTTVFSVLTVVATIYPEYVDFISETQAAIGTLLSLVGIEIAKIDREIKSVK